MSPLFFTHRENIGDEPGVRIRRCLGRIVVGGCILLALSPVLRAVQPYAPKIADPLLDPWEWQKIAELDGKTPRCMIEGKDGAMWFGVNDGVMRFDGESWQSFKPADGLVGTPTNALCCTPDGQIYAGSDRGISRFVGGRWERFLPTGAGRDLLINSLLVAADDSVWAGSAGFILHAQDKNCTIFATASQSEALAKSWPEATIVRLPGNIPMSGLIDIYETRDGMIWYGLATGEMVRHDPHRASREDPTAWRVFTEADGYRRGNGRRVIFQTSDGLVWVGSGEPDSSIARYDPIKDTWAYFNLTDLLGADNLVRSIAETRDGTVWFGGMARISRYREGKWRSYVAPEVPLSSSRVFLLGSQSGDLWVLGAADEVQRIDYRQSRWLKYEGLNFQCETPDGRQWFVAVDNGVVSFDGKQWQRYGVSDGLMRSPYTLLCTREGQLWAAGTHEGKAATAWLTGATWNRKTHENVRPPFGFIIDNRAIFESADGSLWFGTYVNGRSFAGNDGGILQYDPHLGPPEEDRAWQNRDGPLILGRCSNCIVQLADGTLFSGSYGGMMQFDGKAWTHSTAIPNAGIDALCVSREGKLWVGTRGEGLLVYDGKHVTRYSIEDGLKSNAITALLCDRENHLWVGSSKGISYFNGEEWTTDVFLDSKLEINFEGGGLKQAADDALWINQCSRSWLRRVLAENKTDVSTTANFATIRYVREQIAPHAEIVTSVARVSQPGNTVIAWRGHSPWWRTQESDLRYSQRLDDGPWSKFSAETNHVFLQLSPGRHRVEVRVRDRDLNVTPTPARVEFVVLPPIWQQPWFIALVTVLAGAVVTQTTRVVLRERRLRRSHRALAVEIEEHKKTEAQLEDKTDRLEQEIEERTRMEREVENTHKQLLLASRQAGMAEVATSVLHNVGNVLNSVNGSATLIVDKIKQLKIPSLAKTADLLVENAAAPGYLSTDEKGKQIPGYLKSLGGHMANAQDVCVKEMESLRQHIEHIKDIVAMQQTYARLAGMTETVKVSEMVDDAIRMNTGALTRHNVTLVRDFQHDVAVEVEKHKVLQILVNLIRNAKYACDEAESAAKRVTIRTVLSAPERIQIQVIDNGVGIPPENMLRIFNHGFTTRKEGHGFGLHSSANAAKELGGSLTAQSAGPGQGATFILELPIKPAPNHAA